MVSLVSSTQLRARSFGFNLKYNENFMCGLSHEYFLSDHLESAVYYKMAFKKTFSAAIHIYVIEFIPWVASFVNKSSVPGNDKSASTSL